MSATRLSLIHIITYNGEARDSEETTDIAHRELRDKLAELGKLPGVNMTIHDAMRLVQENPKMITLVVQQEMCIRDRSCISASTSDWIAKVGC